MNKRRQLISSVFHITVFTLLTNTILLAQNDPKQNFFAEYEKLIDELRKNDAEILSPENYKMALEKYKEADADYENRESVVSIRSKLDESRKYALRAMEVVKLAKLTLGTTLEARNAALDANAPLYAPDLWDKAEEEMQDACENLEDDDMEDARQYGASALNYYRQAELMAIKNGILGDARTQIDLARQADAEKYCYHTFQNAQNLLAETEQILNSNPYAKEEAIQKALEAAYEGRHAQYLAARIKTLMDNEQEWEKVFLGFEDKIKTLSEPFKYHPKFDDGFDTSVRTLLAHITELKDEKERLLKENSELDEELSRLREKEASTSAELQKKEERERKIQKVKDLFTPSEAKVIYEGDKLILRLVGLTFAPAKAVIQPEYFSLLTKVQRAIREFPDKYILVEGHTDAYGNAIQNKRLSEERARAVKEYLMANMELDPQQIDSFGYGDQKPIATNKTREGRSKNRRIEVVISLEEE
ncbi:MAG TPA: hypothetical protein ENK44_05010 [Caldithrix abyssi]|uniref:OmpA-like domain-containing protein n=1 Tax=Caldithrix abyssi TaxID=187145 RepID=A0A7V4WUN5_CALAY|nr:hypothetical protein [Caldithrix abyssi]